MKSRSFLPRLALVLACCTLSWARAQTPAPAPPATPAPNSTTPPAAAPPPAPVVRERERTVYVPYEDLEKVFKDKGKGVFLPYKEFLDLWNELNLKRQEEKAKAPQDGVVSKAEYTARLEGESLAIDAKITVESFREGWQVIPLTQKGAVPSIAEADAGKASLKAKEDGYDVIVPDKGVYELKLKIYAPVKKTAGKQTAALALPHSAVSRFTFDIPGVGWDFEVTPAAAFNTRVAGDHTELSFFFGSGSLFNLQWSKPEVATAQTPLLLAYSTVTGEVRAGSLVTQAALDINVLRAPTNQFSFAIAKDQTIQSVTGDDVKDWKLNTDGGLQHLVVTPNAPVKDHWKLRIVFESALPKLPSQITLPEIITEGATQDRGEINLSAEPQLDVTPTASADMVQQTLATNPGSGLSAVGSYRFLKHPFKLELAVAEAKPQINVEGVSLLEIKRDLSTVSAQFNYDIRRVGIFEARVVLPAGWTGWEVLGVPADQWSIENVTVPAEEAPHKKAYSAQQLTLKLPKQTTGKWAFGIKGQQQRLQVTEDATLPAFLPRGVVRYDARLAAMVDGSLEVTTKSLGDMRIENAAELSNATNERMSAPDPFSRNNRAADSTSNINLITPTWTGRGDFTLAFRYRDSVAAPAVLSFKARDPQVTVDILTQVQAKEQSLRHDWTLQVLVTYAATPRLILAVPKSAAADVRFVDENVKEIHRDYKPDAKLLQSLPNAANYAFWEVLLHSERLGNFSLSLSLEQSTAASGKDLKLELLPIHVLGAFQEVGQVAVVKDPSLEIRNAQADNLEEIDPKELAPQLSSSGAVLAYKYKTLPIHLSLDVAKNTYIPVPQAIVSRCLLTSAISSDEAQTTEVVYWVTNNSQQFLTVHLPPQASLVSDIHVGGAAQQPMRRNNSSDLLIKLPSKSGAESAAFPVRFVYEIPSPHAGGKLGWSGTFSVESPELVDVKVLESHHQLYLPEGARYTGFSGPMSQSTGDYGYRWVRLRNMANYLIPTFGPQVEDADDDWQPIVGIADATRASLDFQIPKQGHRVKLHRLGPPASIAVSYRSRKLSFGIESLIFLIIVVWGLFNWQRPLTWKLVWAVALGLLAIIATGLLNATDGRMARAVVMAVAIVVLGWLVIGLSLFIRGLGQRIAAQRTAAPKPSTSPTPPTEGGSSDTNEPPTS